MRSEKKGLQGLFFVVYLLFGVYLLNYGLKFFEIPESFSTAEAWILTIAGILMIFGAINILRISRLKQPRLF